MLCRSKFQRVTNAAGDTVAEPGHTTKPSHRMFLRHVSPLVPRAGSWVVEEYINDSVSVDLGICNPRAIGNNDFVVAVQR